MSIIQKDAQLNRYQRTQNTRFQKWLSKAIEIHGDEYDYSLVQYTNSHNKVTIICKIHGEFDKKPCDHINQKQGCPKCSHNYPYTITDIRQKSKEMYGDQYLILDPFLGMKHPLTIICNIDNHGKFVVTCGERHLNHKGGCPKCALSIKLENLKPGNISRIEKTWLDSLNVPLRQHKISIGSSTFLVDGFDPLTNTVYECYGSFWHGNPNQYSSSDLNPVLKKTYGELYQKTMTRESILETQFTVITKWV